MANTNKYKDFDIGNKNSIAVFKLNGVKAPCFREYCVLSNEARESECPIELSLDVAGFDYKKSYEGDDRIITIRAHEATKLLDNLQKTCQACKNNKMAHIR